VERKLCLARLKIYLLTNSSAAVMTINPCVFKLKDRCCCLKKGFEAQQRVRKHISASNRMRLFYALTITTAGRLSALVLPCAVARNLKRFTEKSSDEITAFYLYAEF